MHQQPPRTVSERGTVRSALASPQSSCGDGSDAPFFLELSDLGIAEAEKAPVNFAVVLAQLRRRRGDAPRRQRRLRYDAEHVQRAQRRIDHRFDQPARNGLRIAGDAIDGEADHI